MTRTIETTAPVPGAYAEFQPILISRIRRNPDQPRKHFDQTALDELAASIAESGLLQPITVRPSASGKTFTIVAGERRWRASKIAGLTEVPARVMTLDTDEAFVLSVAENIARADMTPMEEVDAFSTLIRDHGKTTADLARLFGRPESGIQWRLGLASLGDLGRQMLNEGTLKPTPAWYIARLDETTQAFALRRYARGDFATETDAVNYAQALRMQADQGSFFDMAEPETPEAVADRRKRRAVLVDRLAQISKVHALLDEIAAASPEEFADALGDNTAAEVAAIERLARAATRAQIVARKAKAHAEARTYRISEEMV